jgi:hypothetical protein
MQFDSSISNNAPRHKRFERQNSNKKRLNRKCAVSYYLNSLWEHILLGNEHMMFQLTHAS